MTRRIAVAIILTAWAILIVGGAAVYLVTRQLLLADLDESLISRSSALPQLLGVSEDAGQHLLPTGDRYIVLDDLNRIVGRSDPRQRGPRATVVTGRSWAQLADGSRMRNLSLSATSLAADGRESKVTIVYSGSAELFDKTLGRLALLLFTIGIASGVVTAAVAVRVARSALRPLEQTAQTIGAIDERRLDRRIDVAQLPRELCPMAERLNQMLARLDESFTQRKQFLADAAHELRTPVAAILTTLEVTLRRPRDAAALTLSLENCLSDARMLKRLVETLLEHVRGENAGKHGPEPTDVSAILRECATLGESLGQAKGVQILRDFPADLRMVTEPGRLRSVVMNLVSNAVEYNRAGGNVRIVASRENGTVQVAVTDTGIGISPESLPHVFEPFFRGDRARQSDSEHLGLGLFLVRAHIDALNGRCMVQSEIGKGTTFSVTLPAGVENLIKTTVPAIGSKMENVL
jgi:signal transduction histidine kinase